MTNRAHDVQGKPLDGGHSFPKEELPQQTAGELHRIFGGYSGGR
jgi:haloacetate dehalogenase